MEMKVKDDGEVDPFWSIQSSHNPSSTIPKKIEDWKNSESCIFGNLAIFLGNSICNLLLICYPIRYKM